MNYDFYFNALENESLSSSDTDQIIKILCEGGLCVLPSDSAYILTGNLMSKGVVDDIDFLLDRKQSEISLTFNNFNQIKDNFELSSFALDFIKALTPGALTFIAPPLANGLGNRSARMLYTDGTIGIRLTDSKVETQVARDFPIPTAPIKFDKDHAAGSIEEAAEILQRRYKRLSKYRKLASVNGKINHPGSYSTVVYEDISDNGAFIMVKRLGFIPKEKIEEVALKCGYNGIKDASESLE